MRENPVPPVAERDAFQLYAQGERVGAHRSEVEDQAAVGGETG